MLGSVFPLKAGSWPRIGQVANLAYEGAFSMMRDDHQIQLQDGRLLGYAVYGDPVGKPVFFFQGTPSSRLIHPDEDLTRSLGVRLVMMDRPGFGLSDFQPRRRLLDWPSDVAEVADLFGFDRFFVVGISGGGPYVAACAYRIPGRLAGAAIVSSMGPVDAPGATRGMPAIRRAGALVGRHTPCLLRPLIWFTSNPRRNPERFFARNTAHNPPADQVLLAQPGFRKMLMASYAEATRNGIQGYAWEVQILAQPWGFRLEDIETRIDLWHGEEDTSTPPAMARYMDKVIPNCRATYLPNEGHFLLFTHWEEILTALLC